MNRSYVTFYEILSLRAVINMVDLEVSTDFRSKDQHSQVKELLQILKIKGFRNIAIINYWYD